MQRCLVLLVMSVAFSMLDKMDGVMRHSDVPFVSRSALLRRHGDAAHAPFLYSGRKQMWLAWFSGHEGASGCAIAVARLMRGGMQWSPAKTASVELGRSAQNPVLFADGNSTLVLLHTSQRAGPLGVSQKSSQVRRVVWEGQGWSRPEIIINEGMGAFTRGPPLDLSGQWTLPVYFTPSGEFDVDGQVSKLVPISRNGQTWDLDNAVTIPGTQGAVGVQPAVVCSPHDPKTCVVFMRTRVETSRGMHVMRSTSTDGGRTWSTAKATPLFNNNSGIAALWLPSGRIVIALNDAAGYARTPLSLVSSMDGGETFSDPVVVMHRQGFELSYPSLAYDAEDEVIHLAFTFDRETIAHVEFSEDNAFRGGRSVGV